MPIRALDFLLQDKQLIHEAPLSALRDTRLGIDAQVYLRGVLSAKDAKEPLVPALGGVPLALEDHVTNDLRLLEAARIKPVLVFNGITPPRSERPFSTEDSRPGKRQSGWEAYERGRVEAATSAFASVPLTPQDVTRTAQRSIMRRRTEFITAPYLAWAQLVYLERSPKKYTHATWSSTEFLLFEGTEKLILNIDLKAQTFTFISKRELLQELDLTQDQFLDAGIMSGFESAMSIPLPEWSLQAVIDLVKRNTSGQQAVSMLAQKYPGIGQSGYPETFARARALIKHSLVTSADGGKVMPLPLALPVSADPADAVGIPKDLHEVFSQKLPDELYYQMFRGLVSPQMLGPLASGVWVEHVPLCGGESDEYRRFLRDIITEHAQSPRCTALGLLSSCLGPYWQNRPVHAIYYFDPGNNYPIVHNAPAVGKSLERLLHWNVPLPVITEELRRQGSSTLDIRLCLAATIETTVDNKPYPNRTKVIKDADRPLEKKDEIVMNTLWRFLELRGFLTSSHSQTPHGKALYCGLVQSRVNDKFQEPLYLAIELIRAGVLHSGKYGNKTWSGGPNLGGESDKVNAMLIMRVLSIVSLHLKPEAWTGPVSRSLLVFNSFVRTLSRSLRGLLEATTVNMLLKGDAVRNREDFAEISINLPFRNDVNTGMGVLFKGWCDACSMVGTQQGYDSAQNLGGFVPAKADITPEAAEERRENLEEVKTAVAEMLEEGFNSIRDVRGELARGVRFWDTVMVAVRKLHDEKSTLPVDWFLQFEAANKWLEPFRP